MTRSLGRTRCSNFSSRARASLAKASRCDWPPMLSMYSTPWTRVEAGSALVFAGELRAWAELDASSESGDEPISLFIVNGSPLRLDKYPDAPGRARIGDEVAEHKCALSREGVSARSGVGMSALSDCMVALPRRRWFALGRAYQGGCCRTAPTKCRRGVFNSAAVYPIQVTWQAVASRVFQPTVLGFLFLDFSAYLYIHICIYPARSRIPLKASRHEAH